MHIRRKVKNRGRKRDGLDDTVVTGRENIETNYKKKDAGSKRLENEEKPSGEK